MKPAVTIIIAAYGRAATLRMTLQSIYQQTFTNWKVLVLADCCDEDFFLALGDDRFRVEVINLPQHFGNQYGPNSIGLRLASTDFIAFMNHDDLWVSDHLELAMSALLRRSADAYFGLAAFCHEKNQVGWPDGSEPIRFSEYNRTHYYWRSIFGPAYFFEPVSSWVVRTETAKRVGDWLAPDKTDVTSVMNWFARFYRVSNEVVFGDKLSTLKNNLVDTSPEAKKLPRYNRPAVGHNKFRELLQMRPGELRSLIARQIDDAASLELLVRDEMRGTLALDEVERHRIQAFQSFVSTGLVDRAWAGPTIGPYKSENALSAHRWRTGRDVDAFPSVEAVFQELVSNGI